MAMTVLEKELHQARGNMNASIDKLVETAIEDSTTYQEAIKKLKHFRWNFNGQLSAVIIETAIERINLLAVSSQIQKNC